MKLQNKINQIWENTNKPAFIIANTTWLIYWSLTYNKDINHIQNYIQSYAIYLTSYEISKRSLNRGK